MKIPGLDAILFQIVRMGCRIGKIRTVRNLKDVNLNEIRGILVVITTALGDSVTFTPALTALRERFPGKRIIGLYHCAYSELYANDPRFDRIIPYYGKYKRLRKTLAALREESCELALLPYMNDPDIIPLVLAGGSRILFRMPGRNTIYSFLVAHPELLSSVQPALHANRRGAEMVKYLDCRIADPQASLHQPPDSVERVDRLLQSKGVGEGTLLIGFHPGASIPQKRWPPGRFEELGKKLLGAYPHAKIIVTGSPAERRLCDQVCARIQNDRVLNVAGEISIRDLPCLMSKLSLAILGDTGVSHMAYAVKIRTITLFWGTDPTISGPVNVGDRHRLIQDQSAEAISTERVFSEAVDQIRAFSSKIRPDNT